MHLRRYELYIRFSMDQLSEAEKKELLRAKKAAYNAQEHMKERRRIASSARSRAHKVATTEKRLQEHTIEELILIARNRCRDTNIDWNENKDRIQAVLVILHGPETV
jgi:hypothetical protein